ncbi:MAG: bifunctional UDP-N-acetylmuramoyl-tripeptide:D-alanyl-D-alanine ligase/alanine racemase [Flavobacteriales bacterium]|nr:bifunctional UDP-N-acetylmuramoyl-tripeptide:D-alanyl-D-alanine ligase/alanine racemase [Flavobacteriales bacterium]
MSAAGHRISAIAEAVGGHATCADDPVIAHLSIDSRKAFSSADTLFIALRGQRHDGHRYVRELFARGMRHFMVMDDVDADIAKGSIIIRVADTLDALQRLAGWHRAHFNIPVVGITGSNGKTVVKEWLFHLLRDSEHIVRSPGSWNSQVGVPLSVWNMRTEHTLGLFEAGISEPGEMEHLRSVIRPTIGIFTNIGPAHGAGFTSDAKKAEEKALLFTEAGTVVHCADHARVVDALHALGINQRAAMRGWSRERNGWLHVVREEAHGACTRIHVSNEAVDFSFEIPFTDDASVENALHCVTFLLHLGRSPEWIAQRTPQLPPVSMRLETVEGMHGITLLNDAYSNDTASLAIALDQLDALAAGRPKAVVLSDLVGSGEGIEARYERVGQLLQRARLGTVLTIGPELAQHKSIDAEHVMHFATADELLDGVDPATLADHVVLVKGARAFELERVAQRWQRQVHGTVLEVDLEAIRHNLNHYRSKLAPGVRTMAMVKAFGYGAGALELARLFAHENVNYLGVAYADEGVDLRQNGIDLPILVMNPEPVPFEVMHRFALEAEVYDARSLRESIHAATHVNDAPAVHIKLDTGMHRLGFVEAELPQLLESLREAKRLKVASILSHLAAAEDPEQDGFTRAQITAFTRMATAIGEVLGYKPLWHVANSAGITRWPQAHFDMVRLGIGMHGIGMDATETALLLPAAALRTPIAQLKQLHDGDTVGYNRRGRISGSRTLATLPIGYADGLSRRLGNGIGRAWIAGQPAPFIGHVCMDMCMVDVTGIACGVGDMASVFDRDHPVADVARDMGTIAYEVLTSISQRVKRVYVRG